MLLITGETEFNLVIRVDMREEEEENSEVVY
jgi:hypothetical protein